jgi:hypothetical protein
LAKDVQSAGDFAEQVEIGLTAEDCAHALTNDRMIVGQ